MWQVTVKIGLCEGPEEVVLKTALMSLALHRPSSRAVGVKQADSMA